MDEYDTITEDYIGKLEHICPHCNALAFEDEKINGGYSLCCHKGKVKLPQFKGPNKELKKLFTGNSSLAKNFKENIRKYNNACAFASMVSNKDPLLKNQVRACLK